MIRLPPLSVA
ncbi:hypothetical protein YPPY11_4813, partial [Yersinia pestis PY-11]